MSDPIEHAQEKVDEAQVAVDEATTAVAGDNQVEYDDDADDRSDGGR